MLNTLNGSLVEKVDELVKGLPQTADTLIETLMPYALTIAKTHSTSHLWLAEDIAGEAFLALTKAVFTLRDKPEYASSLDMVLLYINRIISREIVHFLTRREPDGEMLPVDLTVNSVEPVDLDLFSPRDREIVEMRLSGHCDREIADHFDLSREAIRNRRHVIRKQLEASYLAC
jgi:DNA-directed RNA polymerase specialized sigma24 family protein